MYNKYEIPHFILYLRSQPRIYQIVMTRTKTTTKTTGTVAQIIQQSG